MMACKARLFGDEGIRRQIMEGSDPEEIKGLSRKIASFDRGIWDQSKYAIVVEGSLPMTSQTRTDLPNRQISLGLRPGMRNPGRARPKARTIRGWL